MEKAGGEMPKPERRRMIEQADYAALAEFRYLIRCFLEFSEDRAKAVGLTPRQHQALLAVKGFGGEQPISVGELAERLRIRHHSAVELTNRLCDSGLLVREPDSQDQRRVLLRLTARAEAHLEELSAAHLDELARIEPMLKRAMGRRRK
ncbi:MarR family winged helix-turn-helix transcriptional regulator [Rhodoligotrophos ferricapiens]|uniref:MarR family winged helix-turn-helix transcriptional regulator n=1 Tax=Rhodoligotrophos ferricapiens TaxID=3069264 RepID=UPI00315DD468